MLLYKRFYIRRMFAFLVLTALMILFAIVHNTGNNRTLIQASRTGKNTKNDEVTSLPMQTPSLTRNLGPTSDSHLEPFCAVFSPANKYLIQPDEPTNFTDWTYKIRRKCPMFQIPTNLTNSYRLKYSLQCSGDQAELVPSYTNTSSDIQIVGLNSQCLATFIDSCCTGHGGVPNVIHYVWYFNKEVRFYMFMSMLSVIRFIRPCLILFHGEFLPYGEYWDYISHIYPNILHIKRPRPVRIFGKKVIFHPHSGDFMRIEAVKNLGGIYFDADVIVLRDLEPLRGYNMTLCYQSNGYLHSAFVMGKKNATFLDLWLDGYRNDYRNDKYTYNAMQYNRDLAKNRTDLVHVINGTLCKPKAMVGVGRDTNPKIVYNWSSLYGYHLYERYLNITPPLDMNLIKKYNTTLGSMLRHIVYGNKELCD